MKKGKSVIFLLVWFMWSAGQDLDTIVRFSIKSDYYIYSSNHITPLFFVFAFLIFSLNLTVLYYLFRPHIIGYYTGFVALGVATFQNILTLFLALRDLPGVRHAYEVGREVRGLSVRQEALDMIFSPSGMYTTLAVLLVFYIVVAYFLFKNKLYFLGSSNVPA